MLTKTIGDRIKYCRQLARLTRHQIEEKYKIDVLTQVFYEKRNTFIYYQVIEKYLNVFKSENLDVQPEWLQFGKGEAPKMLKNIESPVANEEFFKAFDSGYFIILEERNIRLRYKDVIFHTITTNELEPYLFFGDRIAGLPLLPSEIKNEMILNRLCIVSTVDRIYVKYVSELNPDGTVNLCGKTESKSDDEFFLANVKFEKIAPIFWTRNNPKISC